MYYKMIHGPYNVKQIKNMYLKSVISKSAKFHEAFDIVRYT